MTAQVMAVEWSVRWSLRMTQLRRWRSHEKSCFLASRPIDLWVSRHFQSSSHLMSSLFPRARVNKLGKGWHRATSVTEYDTINGYSCHFIHTFVYINPSDSRWQCPQEQFKYGMPFLQGVDFDSLILCSIVLDRSSVTQLLLQGQEAIKFVDASRFIACISSIHFDRRVCTMMWSHWAIEKLLGCSTKRPWCHRIFKQYVMWRICPSSE